MTVFELLVYSCVAVMFPSGSGLSHKVCRWDTRNGIYSTRAACEAAAPKWGEPVWSDTVDGSKIITHECRELHPS